MMLRGTVFHRYADMAAQHNFKMMPENVIVPLLVLLLDSLAPGSSKIKSKSASTKHVKRSESIVLISPLRDSSSSTRQLSPEPHPSHRRDSFSDEWRKVQRLRQSPWSRRLSLPRR